MHFAYPPRKDSNASAFTPHARSSRLPLLRRSRARLFAFAGLFFVVLFYLLSRSSGRDRASPWKNSHVKEDVAAKVAAIKSPAAGPNVATANYAASGKPTTVIVTVFDETNYHRAFLDLVRENRNYYAKRHGYATVFPKVGNYDLHGSPLSWTKVVAMRHALTLFPDTTYFWFLEQDAFIMNMDATVEGSIMAPAKVDEAMIKDMPVVPPDSIIRTFAHLRGQDVEFLLTQDANGLSTSSFIIRNGRWAHFFFETWFDPLYRSYNFQKAETHALEHIVQWHPTILSKMALVPQRMINAYSTSENGAKYEAGDIAVRIDACTRTSSALCENEAMPFVKHWKPSKAGSGSGSGSGAGGRS